MFKINSQKDLKIVELKNSIGITFKFLENGSIFSMTYEQILINQILGNPIEGSLNNIYIRIHNNDSNISYFPIIGPSSSSDFFYNSEMACWKGQCEDLEYKCILNLDKNENIWFWNIYIKNNSSNPKKVDAVFTQDLGIANIANVRTNEAYTSQYIDHSIFKHSKYGYIICSRQNQAQGKIIPWIMHGSLNKSIGFLTDGFQFFGLSYKETNEPEALKLKFFPNKKLQYEFAFPSLQSDVVEIKPQQESNFVFFSLFEFDHKEATSKNDLKKIDKIVNSFKINNSHEINLSSFKKIEKTSNIFNKISMFATKDLNEYEIDTYFSSDRRHIEEINNRLFSFFYSDSLYVVLKAKELNVERPHGHVLRTGKDIFPSDESMSSTTYAYGIFNSQLTIGNTSFNKLLSVSRNHLNVLKSSGQRIFIKEDDGYKLLGVPSAFEIGINHCKWIYKGNNSTIIIKVWTCMHEPACFLEIQVQGNEKKEFIISNNIVLGNNELDSSGLVNIDNKKKKVELTPAHDEQIAKKYPDARFFIVSKDSDKIEIINGDSLLYDDEIDRNNPYVVIKTKPVDKFSLTITGNILSAKNAKMLADKYEKQIYSFNDMLSSSREFWMSLCKNAKIRLDDKEDGVDKLNDILFWYLHNAMVHYTVPHGLEQYSGAAWGVRDVCQGPVEFLISTQNYSYVKDILKLVFAHQYRQSSNWPQWFMFDRFCEYQQHESHGDIIIWPLKALCDYIEATNDFSILDEEVCYTDEKDFSFTSDKDSIFSHTKRLISNIENNSIINTSLLCYGDGDWDDTLQPADASMKKQMVSGWTVELVYQTFNRYKRVCKNANQLGMSEKMEQFCEKIKNDFNKYVIKDGVVSGFVYFHNINNIDNMLHPGGSKTGIKYRLLPMTRGMISEIFTKQQVKDHYKIIKNKLYFPDGVRLMDTPAKYNGGMQKYFKRAETSANFGREIGLQYVHAHIRYIEAMAKIGDADEVYKALLMINPITIDKVVPSAMTRQSNSYFSSSDANFTDRYIAKKDFLKIKKSKVKIKGGWRIYSSGPGIYINQLISNFLGIRVLFDDIVIDPVIPKKLNGLFFNFEFKDKKVEYRYNIMTNVFSPGHVVINGKKVDNTKYEDNPYRRGGLLINKDIFYELLNKEFNVVEIFV